MLVGAAVVIFVLAAIHSVLGEITIFRRLEATPVLDFPPIVGAPQPAHAIMRVCWHLLTLFGAVFAVMIGWLVTDPRTLHVLTGMLATSALLVLVGTRGKHLGWVAFAAAAVLCGLGT